VNDNSLGKIGCPVCGEDCDLKVTKKGKAYVNCGECGSQTFARGVVADKKLRERIRAIETAAANDSSAEVVQPIPKTQAKPKAAPAVTVTRHSSEGDTVKEERTIFDILGNIGKGL
jgi:DNA-directed RNA polymerase subunit RPC12/RpoP